MATARPNWPTPRAKLSQSRFRHGRNRRWAPEPRSSVVAYLRTFARMGLRSIPMVAESGPIGGNLSHEFIILADTGESEVFYDIIVP
jgi:hypothetical protein